MTEKVCLDEADLWRSLSEPDDRSSKVVQSHLKSCTDCRKRLRRIESMKLTMDRLFSEIQVETEILSADDSRERSLTRHPLILSAGDEVGKYVVQESLDFGGQGQVCLAYDQRLDREVALKIGFMQIQESELENEDIVTEGRLLAKINHQQLAQVFDCGVHYGYPYLVMEYVDGMNLSDIMLQGPLSSRRIYSTMREVCLAVQALHQQGILHLDLKPENVMVTPEGEHKLIDLGTAWIKSGLSADRILMAGTPEYMAPEQFDCEREASVQTDVFGIGTILYFLLTGTPIRDMSDVVSGNHLLELNKRHAELRSIKITSNLRSICLKATAIDPKDRYPDVEALLQDLVHKDIRRALPFIVFFAGVVSLFFGLVTLKRGQPSKENFAMPASVNHSLAPKSQVDLNPMFIELKAISHVDDELRFVIHSGERARVIDGLHAICDENATIKAWTVRSKSPGMEIKNQESETVVFAVSSPLNNSQLARAVEDAMAQRSEMSQDCDPNVLHGTNRICPEHSPLKKSLGKNSRYRGIQINPIGPVDRATQIDIWLSLVDSIPTQVEQKALPIEKQRTDEFSVALQKFLWSTRDVTFSQPHILGSELLERVH